MSGAVGAQQGQRAPQNGIIDSEAILGSQGRVRASERDSSIAYSAWKVNRQQSRSIYLPPKVSVFPFDRPR